MKKTAFSALLVGVVMAALLVTLAGCGSRTAAEKDGSLQKILDAGQLVLGLDTDFPPMGFIDEGGEIVGFDIDVAQEVCDRLGVELVTQGIDWEEKEDDLNSGVIDCIWNGLSVTPGRAETMNLSEPYMKNELIIVVLGSSDAKTADDLKGRTVAVQSGSTAQEVLEASALYPEITVETYNTIMIMLDKLNRREVDAVLVDSVAAYYFEKGGAPRVGAIP